VVVVIVRELSVIVIVRMNMITVVDQPIKGGIIMVSSSIAVEE
jgi:hypothetical protein